MKISATLKGTKDSLGRRTVYIRVADGTHRKFHATHIRIESKHWDKQVKKSHPDHKRINQAIKNLILQYEAGMNQFIHILFSKYVDSCIKEWANSKKPETLRQLKGELGKFSRFFNSYIHRITPDTLKKYEQYCYSLGNKTNSVWKSMKFLRLILRKAKLEKVIGENPFDVYRMPKYTDPEKVYLTKDQVALIDNFSEGVYKEAGTWFVISCYTGLRFSDMVSFSKKKIRDGRLIIYTSKTGTPVSIKLNDKLKSLFERINYSPLSCTNQHYNRILKAIGAECEIEDLTGHVARHTCAMMLAKAGVSIEVTAKVLGHQSIRTTAIYYKITGDRIDSELARIF